MTGAPDAEHGPSETAQRASPTPQRGTPGEVFAAFLRLGLTSFGGPIAHLGYFHRELIARRRWVDDAHYAQLVALCQFLPGPVSSQVGFALGMIRAGWPGALAAFVAFTLPSALLLFAFAAVLPALETPLAQEAMHGLKLVAVAVVAQGLWTMFRRLTPDLARQIIAAASAAVILVGGNALVQIAVVAAGALLGLAVCRNVVATGGASFELPYSRRFGALLLVAFTVLLAAALLPHDPFSLAAVAAAFYRAGSLVFGGAHVVLPLLEEFVVRPGWLDTHEFLAGYGAAQAIPGPMFSVAMFLGTRLQGVPGGLTGASVSLVSIFLPGFLLLAGALPFWQRLASYHAALRALAGVNAAVVGLLAAALYDPLWTGAVLDPFDFVIAASAFALLAAARTPVLLVIAWCVLLSVAQALLWST